MLGHLFISSTLLDFAELFPIVVLPIYTLAGWPELMLALPDARPGALPDVGHVLLVELAQLPLAGGQPRELAAHGLGPDDEHLGSLHRAHRQGPAAGVPG